MADGLGVVSKSEHLARFRRELLHASTVDRAVTAALGFLKQGLGLDARVTTKPKGSGSIQPGALRDVDRSAADAPTRAVMETTGLERVWDVVLDVPSFERIIVPYVGADEELERTLRECAADLARTLERIRDTERLRADVARHEQLLREAGQSIVRDAGEVVQVLSDLEQRDASIRSDLHHALKFQRAMLGRLPELADLTPDAIYLPAEIISGDLYEVADLGDGVVRLFIADATGHGIAAGLATMFIKSEYEAQKRRDLGPSELLVALNERLSTTYRALSLRFTAICADIDLLRRRIRYSTAAHPAPLMARAAGVETLATGGPFVGLTSGVEFPEHETTYDARDVFLLFTDGLPDATDANGAMFGDERVVKLLADARATGAQPCPPLVRALSEFVGAGRRLGDDVTVVALTFGPPATSA